MSGEDLGVAQGLGICDPLLKDNGYTTRDFGKCVFVWFRPGLLIKGIMITVSTTRRLSKVVLPDGKSS